MPIEPTELAIRVTDADGVTAIIYPSPKKERSGITLILGHGAGAGQLHPFMRLFASGLAERGLDVMTFNFVYMEKRKGAPDPKAKLEACYRAVIDAALTHKNLKGNRLATGGKSMGGRIASQVATGDSALLGLVFLGYPLHPPGNPEKMRDAHLPDILAPMLFIQGSRDAFGNEDEVRSLVKRLKLDAELHIVPGGDHSLKAPKSAGFTQDEIYEQAMDKVAGWLTSLSKT
jgi:uncharacterized protein